MSVHFLVSPNTVEEEVKRLKHSFRSREFYLKENYVPQLPADLELESWTDFDEEFIREVVIREYNSEVYEKCAYILDKRLSSVEPIFPILEKLNNAWGFKICPQYVVKLTKYGVGGSYSLTGNSVRIRISPAGMFPKSPEQIVVHELVHIGIEQVLVEGCNLTHSEKECLVELLLINLLEDYLPGYKERYLEKIEMNRVERFSELIPHFSSKEFPSYIKAYKENQLRD